MKKFFIFMLLFCFIGLGSINKMVAMDEKKEIEIETESSFSSSEEEDNNGKKVKKELTPEQKNLLKRFVNWCFINKKERTLKALKYLIGALSIEALIYVIQYILPYEYAFGTASLFVLSLAGTLLKEGVNETTRFIGYGAKNGTVDGTVVGL